MKRLCFISILLFSATSFGFTDITYSLKKNDTIYGIAKKYDISAAILSEYNEITDPTKLREGTIIRIPNVYIVQKNDTLYGIARSYSLSVNELREINHLEDDHLLKIGEILVVPGLDTEQNTDTSL